MSGHDNSHRISAVKKCYNIANTSTSSSSSTTRMSTISSDGTISSISDVDAFHSENIVFGVSNEDGEIQKNIGKFSFPWKEVIEHGFSSDYVRCLLSEMTPYALAETEEYIFVVYSPARLIGGSEIANLVDRKRSFSEDEECNASSNSSMSSEASEVLPLSSATLSPASIFTKIKQWFKF